MQELLNTDFSAFPAGWYQIGFGSDIAKGKVKTVHYFGEDIVLFRGKSGTLSAMKPHCPHMGAHFGKGGTVVGDCLQCPFHHWRFKADGDVDFVPIAKRIPPNAKAGVYPLKEVGNIIFVYYNTDEQQHIPDLPEEYSTLEDSEFRQSYLRKKLSATILNLTENLVDAAHFGAVHPPLTMGCVGNLEMVERGNSLHVSYDITIKVNSRSYIINALNKAFSPGQFISFIKSEKSKEFSYHVYTLMTPVDKDCIDQLIVFVSKPVLKAVPGLSWLLTSAYHWVQIQFFLNRTFNQDVEILENRIIHTMPLLSDADGPIIKFRKWCARFYPQKEDTLIAAAECKSL